ncbi:MAG: diacylglycerol kinase family protein [Clostridia bacterium]|nr:diacylglycerol kinase family protein [Clostridia bacterium]
MKYYLNNPLAHTGVKANIPGAELIDATTVDYPSFFAGLAPDDEVVLIGGDGTINYLINHVDPDTLLRHNIYLYGNGSGNDFLNDIGESPNKELLLTPYLTRLPTATVNGREYKFINNMGLGIDGYVSEGTDKAREKNPHKKLNYTGIALKGLLYDFKPYHVWLEVDGKEYEFDHVWMAPSMKGQFYGGGMKAAPGQDRLSDRLTVVICACRSRLTLLRKFPKVFKGTHVKDKKLIKLFTGRSIHVRFSAPCAAMIDGETIPNVTEYWATL